MSNAVIGESIAAAHAGVTAEGDNAVLNAKIVNELLKLLSKGKGAGLYADLKLEGKFDPNSATSLHWLLAKLTNSLLQQVAGDLMNAGSKRNSLSKYKFELSNEIQDLAHLLGLRLIAEVVMNNVNKLRSRPEQETLLHILLSTLQHSILRRHVLRSLGVVDKASLESMRSSLNANNKLLNGEMPSIIDSFGIPDYLVKKIPLASD